MFQINLVQIGDFILAAGRRLQLFGIFHTAVVIEIQAYDRIVAPGVGRLFFQRQDMSLLIKVGNAKPLRIRYILAEDCCLAKMLRVPHGLSQHAAKMVAIEDIISQHQGSTVITNEIFTQHKCLCQTIWCFLHLVAEMHAKLRTIPQQCLKVANIMRCGNNQHITDPCQHQCAQRIKDHWLVIHRQQLLRCHPCQWIQPGPRTTGQNNTLHTCTSCRQQKYKR